MKKHPHFIIMQDPVAEADESGAWSQLGIQYGTRTPVRAAAAKPAARAPRGAKGKANAKGKGKAKVDKSSTQWLKHVAGMDYYPGFSVATTDLTDDEAEQLCKLGTVKAVVPDTERSAPATRILGPQITPAAKPDQAAKAGKAGKADKTAKAGNARYQAPDGKRFIDLDLQSGHAWMPLHANGGMLPLDLSTGTVRPFDNSGAVLPFDKSGAKLPFGFTSSGSGAVLPFDKSGVPLPFDRSGVPLPFDRSGVPLPFDDSGVKLPFSSGPLSGTGSAGGGLLHYALGSIDAMQNVLQRFSGHDGCGSSAAAPGCPAPCHIFQSNPDLTWNLAALGLRARDRGGKGIRVAVLDTGIDLSHPDFAAFREDPELKIPPADKRDIKPNKERLLFCNFTADASGVIDDQDIVDRYGHGTHVCGIIAGPTVPIALPDLPRYAIAPEVTLLVGKVLGNDGKGTDSTILEGISWAVRHGAQVICLSLGEARGEKTPYSTVYEQMADITTTSTSFNALLVSAAGNFSNFQTGIAGPIADPAACPSFMAVGAVNSQLQLCDFSSVQCDDVGLLDLCAPGEAILSTAMGGGYELRSGTSMAAPHVAAVAALYLQQNPDLTLNELWGLLERRALALGSPRLYGRGMVRAL